MSPEPSEQPASVPSASFARLDKHGYLFAHQSYTIRDALYGSVPLLPAAYKTLDTRYFQRLKHLKQLGPSYLVYPGATHTRFSHSIGVYHLTRLALQHLTTQTDFEPEVGRATLAAALLHDVGHFPFSHVMDDISMHGRSLAHGDLSVELVQTDEALQLVLRNDWETDPTLVTDLLSGKENARIPRFLYTLTDGAMDMDKLDYLNRDAHHSGVPYGHIEVQRLVECLTVHPETGDLAITDPGVGTVESVVFAKYLMFRYVYWHHTARIAGAMINRAALDCLLALGVQELSIADSRVRRVCLSTDATLETTLRDLFHEAGTEPPPALGLLARVEERRLYKRAVVLPCADAPEDDVRFRDSLTRRAREEELAQGVTGRLAAGAEALEGYGVLIDVPPVAKFAVDVRGIVLDGDGGRRVESWETAPQASYLNAATVAGMERSMRTMQYLCDTHRSDGEAVRRVLTELLRSAG